MLPRVTKSSVALSADFGFLQEPHGFVEFALLERQPAFQHLHDGGHGRVAGIERQPSALDGEAEGVIVAADAAQAAGRPEVGDGEEFGVVDLAFQGLNEAEVLDGQRKILAGHGHHAFGEPHVQVIEQRKFRAARGGEAREQLSNQSGTGESGIDPLGDQAEKDSGIRRRRVERLQRGGVGRERSHAALHPAKGQMVAKLRDDRVQPAVGPMLTVCGDAAGLSTVDFGCSTRLVGNRSLNGRGAERAAISCRGASML